MPTIPYKSKAGKRLPSVTTVLGSLGWGKDSIIRKANKLGLEGADINDVWYGVAAKSGTYGHLWVEHDVKGLPPPEMPEDADPEVWQMGIRAYEQYLDWKEMTTLKVIASEISLVDETLGFGGTIDGIGTVNGKPCLIDLKTSPGVYDSHLIQVASYGKLWEQHNPDLKLLGGFHILKLSKDGGSFAHYSWRREALEPAWDAFKLLLALHNLKPVISKLV